MQYHWAAREPFQTLLGERWGVICVLEHGSIPAPCMLLVQEQLGKGSRNPEYIKLVQYSRLLFSANNGQKLSPSTSYFLQTSGTKPGISSCQEYAVPLTYGPAWNYTNSPAEQPVLLTGQQDCWLGSLVGYKVCRSVLDACRSLVFWNAEPGNGEKCSISF